MVAALAGLPLLSGVLGAGTAAGTTAFAGTNLLSAGLTAAGAAGSALGGFMQLRSGMFQKEQLKMQARNERVQALQKSNDRRRQFLQEMATAQASFAGRGVDLSSGSVGALISRGATSSARDIRSSMISGQLRSQQALEQGKQAATQGTIGFAGGLLSGAGIFGGSRSIGTLLEGF